MTYEQRQAKGKILCEKLAGHVAVIAPTGIGLWDQVWGIVDCPSANFMAGLSAWEIDPSDATMQAVSDAYDLVLESWRFAALEFTEREVA